MSKKLKAGTKATILFAGSEHQVEFIEIRTRPWGNEEKTYFVFKGEDGTIYPISDPNNIKI